MPESIRDSSRTRASPLTATAPGLGAAADGPLAHRHLGVGEGRDLRQVGDHEHLVAAAQGGRGRARRPGRPRRRCRRRPRRTPACRAPRSARGAGPASSGPARRPTPTLASGRAARRGWRRAGTSPRRPGRAAVDRDLEPGPGHGQLAQVVADGAGQPRRGGPAGLADPLRPRRPPPAPPRPALARAPRPDPRSPPARRGAPRPRRGTPARRPASRRTCGAAHGAAARRSPIQCQSLRVVLDGLALPPQLGGHVVELGGEPVQPVVGPGEDLARPARRPARCARRRAPRRRR